jgi:hypothetical protein
MKKARPRQGAGQGPANPARWVVRAVIERVSSFSLV